MEKLLPSTNPIGAGPLGPTGVLKHTNPFKHPVIASAIIGSSVVLKERVLKDGPNGPAHHFMEF